MDDVQVDGRSIRADDVGGVFVQYVKLDLGVDGISTPVVGQVPVSIVSDPSTGADGTAPPARVTAVGGTDGTDLQTIKTDVDGVVQVAIQGSPIVVPDPLSSFNITTDDLNTDLSVFTSLARTEAPATAFLTNNRSKGVRLFLSIADAPITTNETLEIQIDMIDPATGNALQITSFSTTPTADSGVFASPPVSFVYELYPGATGVDLPPNVLAQSNSLPRSFSVRAIHSGTSPWTYGVGASFIR